MFILPFIKLEFGQNNTEDLLVNSNIKSNNNFKTSSEVEQEFYYLFNNYRGNLNLPLLDWDANLYEYAYSHSEKQANSNILNSVLSPHQNLQSIMDSLPYYEVLSENFSVVPSTYKNIPQKFLESFKKSRSHHKTMISREFCYTALAVYYKHPYYVMTHLFGGIE